MDIISLAQPSGKEQSTCNPLLNAALEYAGRGWRVLPLHSPTSGGCSCRKHRCGHIGKHPRTINGLLDATIDAATIHEWWERWPDANIGIATGRESGLFVLDVDGEDGEGSLQALTAEHGELPITLCARTGRTGRDGRRKGCHFYFRSPVGAAIRNSAERLGTGLDIRGEGGYVVAPPSLHNSGLHYEWEKTGNGIASAPDWLIKLAGQPASGAKRHHTKAPGKGRNVALTTIAGRFRRAGHVPAEIKAELLLRNHSHIDPLPEAEVETIVKSIANYSPGLGRMNSLPLAEFVREAIRRNGSHHSSPSKFKSPLFHFARIIRSRAVFADLDALSVAERIDPTLRDLANGEVDAWRHHFGDLSSDPRAAFCYAWEQIKSPSISNPLEEAYFEAMFFPLAPSKVYSEGYARFVSIAGHRQKLTPGDDIILPVKILAEMLDCDRTSISYYLKRAKADGLLKETKPYSYTKHKASEYRFLIELWDFKSGQQIHTRRTVTS